MTPASTDAPAGSGGVAGTGFTVTLDRAVPAGAAIVT
jgi:hypothetical protein